MSKKILIIIAAVVFVGILVYFIKPNTAQAPESSTTAVETTEAVPVITETVPVVETSVVTTPVTPEVVKDTKPTETKKTMTTATIETTKGKIVIEFFPADAPKTVENFLTLAKKKFYDGVIFHRVISGFMIQGGDPTGTGMGGPGYQFADELYASTESYKRGYVRGTVAMANAGPNTNGSQFFIMHADYALPHSYTIFGRVVEGMDVVDAIATTPKNSSDKPLTEVKMTKVTVSEATK